MKILTGYFNTQVDSDDIFRPTIEDGSSQEISSDNGITTENFATSKNLIVKSTTIRYRNIHKFTWTSPAEKTDNQIDHILIDRSRHSSVLDVQ
jgi:hypothetical protein